MDCEYDDILRAQTGDREAFGRLVERHQDLVYGICYGMTAQGVDAEDLAHEAFVEAFLKLHTLRDAARFRPWLRTLTLNVCRMWHRDKKRESVAGLHDLLPGKEKMEREAQLSGYFARLSNSHRMALALHYWEGLSYEEMARFLEVPIGTVMSRLSRARDALRDVMEQSEDIAMDGESDLQVEVDAEIEVLLKLFGDDMNSMDRLSVVLEKSPDRFRQVISQVEDGATVEQVAMLVRHFGQPAVEATLGCYFDGDAEDKAKAFAVLQLLVTTWVGRDPEKRHLMPMVPGAYFVLDAIMQSAHTTEVQVDLLIDLIGGSAFGSVSMVFACVLRGYDHAAFPILMTRFQAVANPGERGKTDGLSEALRLYGTRFFKKLLAFLRRQERHAIQLGLRGAGVVVGLLDTDWVNRDSKEERTIGQRTRGLLFSDQMDAEVLDEITHAVADLVSHSEQDIRIWAIDILKHLPLGVHLAKLRACLSHDDRETQVVSMRALAGLGDRGCVQVLIDTAIGLQVLNLKK